MLLSCGACLAFKFCSVKIVLLGFQLQYFFVGFGVKVDGGEWEVGSQSFPNGPGVCTIHHFHWWDWLLVWYPWRRKWERSFPSHQDWVVSANAGHSSLCLWVPLFPGNSVVWLLWFSFLYHHVPYVYTVRLTMSKISDNINYYHWWQHGYIWSYMFFEIP